MRALLAATFFLAAAPVLAQPFPRAGWREYSLQPHLLASETYDFAGGASARLDSGAGIGLGLAQHLTGHFAVGVDFALSTIDYRARVAPASGNPGAAFDETGTVDRGTLLFHATWHLLAARSTPFLSAGLGATHLDPELDGAPPASGCWTYPFWDRFCGAAPPSHGMTRLTYALGAGLRHDLPDGRGFLRALVAAEFIDWTGEPERLEALQLRADFGLKF